MTIHHPVAPTTDDRPDGAARRRAGPLGVRGGGGIRALHVQVTGFLLAQRPVTKSRYAWPLRRRDHPATPGRWGHRAGLVAAAGRPVCRRVGRGTCLERMSARAGPFHSPLACYGLHSNSMESRRARVPASLPSQEPEHLSLWPLPVSQGSGSSQVCQPHSPGTPAAKPCITCSGCSQRLGCSLGSVGAFQPPVGWSSALEEGALM